MIYNLINNAIKYRSPQRRPEILVRTEREDDFMIITIKDNGSGIAQADLPDIFKKYHRLSDVVEGSGVGLYLVNEIVSHSGGKISVESTLGQGSVFRISLKLEPLDSRV